MFLQSSWRYGVICLMLLSIAQCCWSVELAYHQAPSLRAVCSVLLLKLWCTCSMLSVWTVKSFTTETLTMTTLASRLVSQQLPVATAHIRLSTCFRLALAVLHLSAHLRFPLVCKPPHFTVYFLSCCLQTCALYFPAVFRSVKHMSKSDYLKDYSTCRL